MLPCRLSCAFVVTCTYGFKNTHRNGMIKPQAHAHGMTTAHGNGTITPQTHGHGMATPQACSEAVPIETMTQCGSQQDESQLWIELQSQDARAKDSSVLSYWTWLRADVLKLVKNKWFDRTVLVLIGANTVILMNKQYRAVNDGKNGNQPLWNVVTSYTEPFFVASFLCEMLLKWIALGFTARPNGYFRDAWNILDFVVVASDVIHLFLAKADMRALRSFRVLRPLRSLNRMRGMRALVGTVLLSISKLANAGILGLFLLVLYAILGLNLWGGLMHRRCRLTDAPIEFIPFDSSCSSTRDSTYCVRGPDTAGRFPANDTDYILYSAWCNSECQASLEKNSPHFYWPLDDTQERLCGGLYTCAPLTKTEDTTIQHAVARGITTVFNDDAVPDAAALAVVTTCGSPLIYDQHFGISSKKLRAQHAMVTLVGDKNMALLQVSDDVHIGPLDFGFTRFDTMGNALVTVFQCITLEGWTNIMYMVQDASDDVLAIVYFFSLVVAGSYFLLNCVLAIVWEAFISYSRQRKIDECGGALPSEQGETSGDGWTAPTPRRSKEWRVPQWARSALSAKMQYHGSRVRSCCRRIVKSVQQRVRGVYFHRDRGQYYHHVDEHVSTSKQEAARFHPCRQRFFLVCIYYGVCILLQFALTPCIYWTKMTTVLDGILTITSIIAFIAPGETSGAPTTLRSFRLLRAFKLARVWSSFRLLLKSIAYAMLSLGHFTFLLLLVIIVFALLGQFIFALQFTFDANGNLLERCQGKKWLNNEACQKELCPIEHSPIPTCVPRGHFDTFLWSFVTVFQILSLENWNEILYNAMQAVGGGAVFYFAFVIVVGSFIILNLFIAIIMTSFDEQSTKIRRLAAQRRQDKLLRLELSEYVAAGSFFRSKTTSPWFMRKWRRLLLPGRKNSRKFSFSPRRARRRASTLSSFNRESSAESGLMDTEPSCVTLAQRPDTASQGDIEANPSAPVAGDKQEEGKAVVRGTGVCHLERVSLLWKNVRTRCHALSQHKHFDQCVLAMIVLCSATLVVSTPLQNPEGNTALIVHYGDWVFTVFFLGEMSVKIVGSGVRGYIHSWWNCLDGMIVVTGLVGLLMPPSVDRGMSGVKVCRLIRALRPLRMINRNPNLKVVINTIFQSLPQLCNLLVVTLFFFLVFGILGVVLFSGGFYECKDASFRTISLDANDAPRTLCLDTDAGTLQVRNASSTWCQGNVGAREQYVPYVRPSNSTPVCVLHCDHASDLGNAAIQCQKSPWEYEVARCVDCQRLLCPTVDREVTESCEDDCWDPKRPFCSSSSAGSYADGVSDECHAECVAQCSCAACEALIHDAAHCVEQGHRWVSMEPSFDNIVPAMVSLFGIATTEGWVQTMYAGVDASGPYRALVRDNHEWYAFFFVAFIMFGSFCVLNLCVGVIIDNFSRLKGANGGVSMLMTQAQTRWVESQETFFSKSAYFTKLMSMHVGTFPRYRKWLFLTIMSETWDRVIMIAICLNAINMALPMHPVPYTWWMPLNTYINYGFAVFFNAEVVCKVIALREVYFIDPWNRFDFFCVQVTNVGIAMTFVVELNVGGGVLGIFRLFRMVRLFRLVRFFKRLTQLFAAFFLCIPKLVNVGGILALFLFVYAVVGMHLFAKTRSFGPIDDHAHFRDWFHAMLTLIRAMTGEGWNDIMYMYGKEKWYFEAVLGLPCEEIMMIATAEDYYAYDARGEIDAPVECGSYSRSLIFFIIFTLTVAFVILNLFIAVIMDGFDDSTKAGEKLSSIISMCLETWKRYDKEYCLKLPLEDVFSYINEVMESLGSRKPHPSAKPVICVPPRRQSSQSLHDARVLQLRVTPENMVHFNSVILSVLRLALVGNSKDVLEELEAFERGDVGKPKNFIRKEKKFQKAMQEGEEFLSWEKIMAAIRIQRRLKARIVARKARQAEEQAKARKEKLRAFSREAREGCPPRLLKRGSSAMSLDGMAPKMLDLPSNIFRKIANAREHGRFDHLPSLSRMRRNSAPVRVARDLSIASVTSEDPGFAEISRKREKMALDHVRSIGFRKITTTRDCLDNVEKPSLVSKTMDNSEIGHASCSRESTVEKDAEFGPTPSKGNKKMALLKKKLEAGNQTSMAHREISNTEDMLEAAFGSSPSNATKGTSSEGEHLGNDLPSPIALRKISKTSNNSKVYHPSSIASQPASERSDDAKFTDAPSMESDNAKSADEPKCRRKRKSSIIGGT